MDDLDRRIAAFRERRGLDPRLSIFDVRARAEDGTIALTGQATEHDAVDALIEELSATRSGAAIVDEVRRLPDPALGERRHALVRSALAPVLSEPRISAGQLTQYVLGQRVELLAREGSWLRVRGEDAYIGWIHQGYLEIGEEAWVRAWERGAGGDPAIALGAELLDDEERTVARLPWGARVINDSPTRYRLPDGRQGVLGAGEIVATDRLRDRFPVRRDSLARTARRWLGCPYVWGGVTPWGVDCSGFVQMVFWTHGLALPRDSDMQARVGVEVPLDDGFRNLLPGDLLFFAEKERRISHVALSLGGGQVVHAALSNGGVATNDLTADGDVDRWLASILVSARRCLPDPD